MHMPTSLVVAALFAGSLTPALAQNTPEENNPNADAPFVRHIRPDRPGQTISAGVLRAGQFQLETGWQHYAPGNGAALNSATATLRIGFFNSMEFRLTQSRVFGAAGGSVMTAGDTPVFRADSVGWSPLTVGTKLMLTADRAARFQAAMLVEAALPGTGQNGLRRSTWAPGGRLLLSQQLGRRAALEGNFGFSQQGLTVADALSGQYVGSLALTAPLGNRAGYFLEAYGRGRQALTTGATAGLYYRPWTGLRFDATVGKVLGGPATGATTAGLGLAFRLGQ